MKYLSSNSLPNWWLPIYFLVGITMLLLLAIFYYWDHGFYQFLRLSVFSLSATYAYRHFNKEQMLWGGVAAATALLFNPAYPVELERDVWRIFNFLAIPALWLSGMVNPTSNIKFIFIICISKFKISRDQMIFIFITLGFLFGVPLYFGNSKKNDYLVMPVEASQPYSDGSVEEDVPKISIVTDQNLIEASTPQIKWFDSKKWIVNHPFDNQKFAKMPYPMTYEVKDLVSLSLPSETVGAGRRLVLQTAQASQGNDCHFCQVVLSGYIIAESNGAKQMISAQPLLDSIGHNGSYINKDSKFQIMQLKGNDVLFFASDRDMGQGVYVEYWQVYGIFSNKIWPLGTIDLKVDNSGNCSDDKKYGMNPCVEEKTIVQLAEGKSVYPDIIVTTKGMTLKDGFDVPIPFQEKKRLRINMSKLSPQLEQIGIKNRKEQIPKEQLPKEQLPKESFSEEEVEASDAY